MTKKIDKVKYGLSKPEAEKLINTAIGRGMAEVIAEKQERIDRLQQMILSLHDNICRDVESQIWYDDDKETTLYIRILEKVKELKTSNNAQITSKNKQIQNDLFCK